MSRGKAKPVLAKLHELAPGQSADFFAQLVEHTHTTTRNGKQFFHCRFRDAKRSVAVAIWSDSSLYHDCEQHWRIGFFYKIRGTFTEHERYGPQIDIQQLREVNDDDRTEGFAESDFFERSRFDSDAMFAELRGLVEAEVKDAPLRTLVLGLIDAHAVALKVLPAHPKNFFPFPGGWLEHTVNVVRNCVQLADRYILHYPELKPPLNRDLIVAGAALHEIGRVAELTVPPPGLPPDETIPGHLVGHLILGRDLVRDAAKLVPDLNPQLVSLLEHLLLSYLSLPAWGSARLPYIPEVLILHHADDLDAKLEMYIRCLVRDRSDGPFTERDPILGKPLFKGREV